MTLILLPNLLDESSDIDLYLPKKLKETLLSLDGLIAESEKSARHFLFKFLSKDEFLKIKIKLLNEHTKQEELKSFIKDIASQRWGLISDAGLPCIADPGSNLVKLAHENNIEVEALFGPSSIFLSLMLSGLNAQKFSFLGYLPREENLLVKEIKSLENISSSEKSTQIFIEAPYRSDKIFELLKKHLKETTYLCIAVNLTSKDQKVITKSIKEMRKVNLIIGKNPTIFLVQAF
jgi:16S rRNA (cytidine1402-2'-O)-methyltransferase